MIPTLKNFIIDMDGVLWHGDTPLPGLVDFFTTLRQQQINFVLATNNASKTPEQYTEKLARLGVDVSTEQILTSAEATAGYARQTYEPETAAFVVGDEGLRQALRQRQFRLLTVDEVMDGETAVFVAVGFSRRITYEQFAAGALAIHRGADFIGSNPDVSFPSEWGPLPGAGSFLALLQAATGVEPTIIGKPGPLIFEDALRRLKGAPQNTAMVGDRLETDIKGAKAAGIGAILLLSGISQREDLAHANGLEPDDIFADIIELTKALKSQ